MPGDDGRLARLEATLELHNKHVIERIAELFDRLREAENKIDARHLDNERRHREVIVIVEKTINGRIKKVEADRDTLEKMLRDLIVARLEVQEAKNAIARLIVFGLAGGILVAFLNFIVGGWIGTHPVKFPSAPPYHSTEEIKERPAP